MGKYVSSIVVFFLAYAVLGGIFGFGESTGVALALIAAALFYGARNEKQQKAGDIASQEVADQAVGGEDAELERDYEFGGILGAKPRQGTEARAVQEEVKRRKKIAEDKGVKELISDLYFGDLHYYPHWIKNSREYVPKIVTDAKEKAGKVGKNERDKETIELSLGEKVYKFVFQEDSFTTPDGEWHTHGLLELFTGDKRVLAVQVSRELDRYGSSWHPVGIGAFIDGPWIEDFQLLKKAIAQSKKDRALKEAEDPEKTAELKKSFGIE